MKNQRLIAIIMGVGVLFMGVAAIINRLSSITIIPQSTDTSLVKESWTSVDVFIVLAVLISAGIITRGTIAILKEDSPRASKVLAYIFAGIFLVIGLIWLPLGTDLTDKIITEGKTTAQEVARERLLGDHGKGEYFDVETSFPKKMVDPGDNNRIVEKWNGKDATPYNCLPDYIEADGKTYKLEKIYPKNHKLAGKERHYPNFNYAKAGRCISGKSGQRLIPITPEMVRERSLEVKTAKLWETARENPWIAGAVVVLILLFLWRRVGSGKSGETKPGRRATALDVLILIVVTGLVLVVLDWNNTLEKVLPWAGTGTTTESVEQRNCYTDDMSSKIRFGEKGQTILICDGQGTVRLIAEYGYRNLRLEIPKAFAEETGITDWRDYMELKEDAHFQNTFRSYLTTFGIAVDKNGRTVQAIPVTVYATR